MAAPAVRFGADVLLHSPEGAPFRERLRGRRVALVAHPASVDARLRPVWERLGALPDVRLTALLSPQHGFAGEKQDDMVESAHGYHAGLGVPIYSLYGDTRRLRPEWIDRFDVLLFDLQDVGVRVYTFLTTLGYLLADLAGSDRELWVLDRPNPAGRCVEGLTLQPGQESFVGLAATPMQHGLTLGECADWYRRFAGLAVRLTVVPMLGWDPQAPWPADRVWLQPSPNMPSVAAARAYPGTVLLEGTTLSEGRGTTRPLSLAGHPEVDWPAVRRGLEERCPELLTGLVLRDAAFEPTFHKHAGRQCPGFELVTADPVYDPARCRPYRLIAAILKIVRGLHPALPLWRPGPYEYEFERLPIDVIAGGPALRRWVDDADDDSWDGWDAKLRADERAWVAATAPFRRY